MINDEILAIDLIENFMCVEFKQNHTEANKRKT